MSCYFTFLLKRIIIHLIFCFIQLLNQTILFSFQPSILLKELRFKRSFFIEFMFQIVVVLNRYWWFQFFYHFLLIFTKHHQLPFHLLTRTIEYQLLFFFLLVVLWKMLIFLNELSVFMEKLVCGCGFLLRYSASDWRNWQPTLVVCKIWEILFLNCI